MMLKNYNHKSAHFIKCDNLILEDLEDEYKYENEN